MSPQTRTNLLWIGGGVLVVAAVVAWLVLTAPEQDVLPEVYNVL